MEYIQEIDSIFEDELDRLKANLSKQMESLRTALEDKNMENVGKIAHQLKGSQIFTLFQQEGKTIDSMVKEDADIDSLKSEADKLFLKYQHMKIELKDLI